MAVAQNARRILSSLLSNRSPPRLLFRRSKRTSSSSSIYGEAFSQILPAANSFFQIDGLCRRGLQTVSDASKQSIQDSSNLNSDSSSTSAVSNPISNEDTLKHRVTSNLKISSTHDRAMVFTCKVCDTRSVKTFSSVSYEKGVVLARCGGCDNIHLISDRLGWFGEPGSIEELLAARGEEVKKGSTDTISLTLEDLSGKEKLVV